MPDNQKGRANASGEVVEEEDPEVVKERQQKKLQELIEKIRYSDNYTDDNYLYRHVTLPKGLLRIVPLSFWSHPDRSGGLRLLSEDECRQIGIQQSNGWEHYEVHAPEPQILLFRRPQGTYGQAHR